MTGPVGPALKLAQISQALLPSDGRSGVTLCAGAGCVGVGAAGAGAGGASAEAAATGWPGSGVTHWRPPLRVLALVHVRPLAAKAICNECKHQSDRRN